MKINTEDVSLILKAFNFAALKHRDQRRKDERASPYINHPITVAETLWKIGGIRKVTTLVAGILHDIIEDTDTAPEELERQFGPKICHIVKELTDDKRLLAEARQEAPSTDERGAPFLARPSRANCGQNL
jgi:guanosine-3',5'-bis(diphosphate) 3'-pyrophosphohydrolase